MKVSVNNRPVAMSLEDAGTLAALLDNLRERGEICNDEVVVGLEVGRRAFTSDDLEKPEGVPLHEASEVAIATDDMRGYARRILTDARGMLSVLREATASLASEFRTGAPEKANADLFHFLNALQRFLACLYHVSNTCGLTGHPFDSSRRLFAQVTAGLDAIESSQEQRDWTSLAARLELDLLPALEGLESVLQEMIRAI